jgi:hypothetical protein
VIEGVESRSILALFSAGPGALLGVSLVRFDLSGGGHGA